MNRVITYRQCPRCNDAFEESYFDYHNCKPPQPLKWVNYINTEDNLATINNKLDCILQELERINQREEKRFAKLS